MRMDVAYKSRKACKRALQDKNETLTKKAKFNGFVEGEHKYDVASQNTDLGTSDIICDEMQDEFNGQSMRILLTTSNNLNALRKFVTMCNENKQRDLAAEYLLAGGSVLEVLKLLDSSDKNTINSIPVFSAINILLMRILAKYPQYQNSTIEACRHLLNSHMSIIHSMLSTQSNAKQRKVVLRLLAVIASLDGSLSRELLIHLTLQPRTLESLVQHTKPTDQQNVRTCFIHFVLAFLVEGNTSVIRMLLDKRNLLSCIFSDMLYDSKDIVSLVLVTVRTYVLKNTSISKTTKLHVFSASVVSNLVLLYNWKGPNNWPKNKTRGSSESEDFLADKEVVTNIVHEFLITLLTSHRYGIIFRNRTLDGARNKLVYTVLQNLEKPWEHEKPSDLIIKIMGACPDLIRFQYSAIEPFLEPRISPKWICLLTFVKKIIKSIDSASCIKTYALELTPNHLINALLSLTIPSLVVKDAIIPGLEHDNLSVRHEALNLLLVMVHQLKIISLTAKEFYKTSAIQNQITGLILRVIPNLEMIIQMWSKVFKTDTNKTLENTENIKNPELLDHLDVILDVLYSYKDVCPELLDGLPNFQPNELLSSLNNFQSNEDGTKLEKLNHMKVKVIQFLLALDSSIFVHKEKTFEEAFLFLVHLIRQKMSLGSYNVTKTLLNVTGLFEGCDDQLDIWINGFLVVTDPEENKEITQWFMSVLKRAIKHTDKYINSIIQAEEMTNEQMTNLDIQRAEDVINELFDKTNKILSPCKEEFSTVESSLINGRFGLDTKKDNESFNKFNQENSEDIIMHTDNYITQRTKQVVNSDVKNLDDTINRLLNKINPNSFSSNGHPCSKVSSTLVSSLINGQLVNFNINKTDDVIKNSFDKFGKENLSVSKMQTCTSVSPLLCCALQKINDKNCSPGILAYLSYVMVHSLHHQVCSNLLVHMATDLTSLPVYKYLQSWSSNNQPIFLKNKLLFFSLLRKISNILLWDSKLDIIELSKLFGDGSSMCYFKYEDQEVIIKHSLSQYDVRVLLKMTVFYLAQLAQRGILQQTSNENCKIILITLLNITQSMKQENMTILEEYSRCIFTHPILLYYFSPFCGEASKNSIENMITQIILEVCKTVTHLYEEDDGTKTYNTFFAFRDKFLTQLGNIIEKKPLEACSNNYDTVIELLKILQLRVQDVTSLLTALMNLEKNIFISSDKQNLSVFGHIVPVLLDIYCSKESRVHCNQSNILNNQFIEKFSLHLVHLKSSKIKYLERWEQALTKYLSIFPHYIASVSTHIFALLLTKGISTSTIQLIAILITKNARLIPSLVKYFLKIENMKQKDIVFPILNSNLNYKWNERFLKNLYECYGNDIATYLTEPQNPVSWIEENTAIIMYLIKNTFDLALCEKICDNISQSGNKLDMVSICFVQLLEILYKRYESLITVKEKPLTDLIKILVHIMTLTLKKEPKNIKKIKILCEKLDNTVIHLKKIKGDFIFSSLSKTYMWPQFTRFSLKLGLKDAKDDETQSNILKILSNLCNIAYGDNSDDNYTKILFKMTTSHSEFVNVMLGSSTIKGDLVELLRILTRKNHSVITASHVPLYFAAYNATLSHVDQRILQILQHYETHNVKLQQYWPYLWGSAAATRYSVKGETDTALWRQPSTSEILNLFDKDIVNETIRNYPIHRALKDDKLHENSNVYDPAFYLPLLCSLLMENNLIACYKISQNGALALALAACCSNSSDVRMAAYTIISRYYFHLEASKSKEKLLWMRLIDALRNGIISLTRPLKDVRLSCLATTFLAKASLIASHPLHPLYSPLHNFLMAKPALDLNTIPELLQLFHSSHVEHKAHRHWILESIRDGMKETSDVDVALKCMLFKMLLDFYTCILSDAKTKKLILEIIASTTRISKASLLLTRGYGMLPWLHEVVNHLDVCEAEIDTILIIIENVVKSLDSLAEDSTHYKFVLFNILLRLKERSKNRHKIQ